jgi:hypothetical protein
VTFEGTYSNVWPHFNVFLSATEFQSPMCIEIRKPVLFPNRSTVVFPEPVARRIGECSQLIVPCRRRNNPDCVLSILHGMCRMRRTRISQVLGITNNLCRGVTCDASLLRREALIVPL